MSIILQIAKEIAVKNPKASTEEISEVIIDTIESEDALVAIFGTVKLPTNEEVSIRKFLVHKAPKRYPVNFKHKLDLIDTINETKNRLAPDLWASSRQNINIDGSNVAPELVALQMIDGNIDLKQRPQIISNAQAQMPLPYARRSGSHNIIISDNPLEEQINPYVISISCALNDMEDKVANGTTLLFDDISKILVIIESTNDHKELSRVIKILQLDIEQRNRVFNIDFVKDLYKLNNILPSELRTSGPNPDNIMERIYERIRAILLSEQRRLHQKIWQEFAANQITYQNYLQNIRRYAADVNFLYPTEP